MQPDTLIPGAEISQSWNRYSYTVNNPVNYRDSTGHCFEPASALICLGFVILGAVAIKAGLDSRAEILQHPAEIAQEQQAAKQWQDNCMGQCHYSQAVGPTPNVIAGGPRPATPYNDRLAEADWSILNGIVSIAGVGVNAVNSLRNPALMARRFQGSGDYPGIDVWENTTLPKGTKVLGGEPGQSAFYTPEQTLAMTGNDATKLNQGLQIAKGKYPKYRAGMTLYETTDDINVATSTALANPQNGVGGFTQYYIPQYKTKLQPIVTYLMEKR